MKAAGQRPWLCPACRWPSSLFWRSGWRERRTGRQQRSHGLAAEGGRLLGAECILDRVNDLLDADLVRDVLLQHGRRPGLDADRGRAGQSERRKGDRGDRQEEDGEKPGAEPDPKDAPKSREDNPAKERAGKKPFVDRQLEKAVAVLKSLLLVSTYA